LYSNGRGREAGSLEPGEIPTEDALRYAASSPTKTRTGRHPHGYTARQFERIDTCYCNLLGGGGLFRTVAD